MSQKDVEEMANSVDPDQTAPEQSSLGLLCLPRPICPKTLDYYGTPSVMSCLKPKENLTAIEMSNIFFDYLWTKMD